MIRIGTCSWKEKTLLQSDFYPRSVKTAEDRLKFYTEHFDTVEVDSSYYAISAERISEGWAERTPDNFVFHIKAYGALTGHSIDLKTLPKDIRSNLPDHYQDKCRAVIKEPALLEDIYERFYNTLQPLHHANKLGIIVFQYPPWFYYSEANLKKVLRVSSLLSDYRVGIEFRHGSWLTPDRFETVISALQEHNLIYITADEPQYDSLATIPFKPFVTGDIAYVRFHGRNKGNWLKKGIDTSLRYSYDYSLKELDSFLPALTDMNKSALVTFAVFNNCHSRKAIDNAILLRDLLNR
ncbi:MAG: DUF72 domain-containing protein [Candidatus Auribacterota bacterium]